MKWGDVGYMLVTSTEMVVEEVVRSAVIQDPFMKAEVTVLAVQLYNKKGYGPSPLDGENG